MKPKLSIGVCILISLALVLFGLIFGTLSGFNDDRKQVMALLDGEGGLMDALQFRGADGLNLSVVARRHLSAGDADVLALENAAKKLRESQTPLSTMKEQDGRLAAAVERVAEKLTGAPSFQASPRDKSYLDMLRADLQKLSASPVIATYNQAAADFNKQLGSKTGGALARLLGMQPCELYQ
jgi:hypothetical protein